MSVKTVVDSIQLAIAGTSGEVNIIRISLLPDSSLRVEHEHKLFRSPKTITCMTWLKAGHLAVARLGEVIIWTPTASYSISLPIENYRGWPSIATPVKLTFLPVQDVLLVTCSDGTFREIPHVSASPCPSTVARLKDTSTLHLNDDLHRVFTAVGGSSGQNNSKVFGVPAMIVSGFVGLDNGGAAIWAYERHMQNIKVYNMLNLHNTTLMIGRVYSEDLRGQALQDLKRLLTFPESGKNLDETSP